MNHIHSLTNIMSFTHFTICIQVTRHKIATEAVCHWLVHEQLTEDGHVFHPKDRGTPWTKCYRPTSPQCYYFIQHLYENHNPVLGTPIEADLLWKDVKSIQVNGGVGKTKTMRDRVKPIALRYIQSDMPDVYEVQAARRADLNAATATQSIGPDSATESETEDESSESESSAEQTPRREEHGGCVYIMCSGWVGSDGNNTKGNIMIAHSKHHYTLAVTPSESVDRRSRRISTRITDRSCWPLGTKISTKFDGISYTGVVTKILPATHEDEQLWHVTYVDGDEADLDKTEMEQARKLYVDGRVGNDSSDDDDDDDDDDEPSSSVDEYDPFDE